MARALRVQFEGAIYHVTARGNERRAIFRGDRDHERFLETLAEQIEAHHVRLYAYVLMTNHYHLLVETPRANLAVFMQQFNGAYTVYFNRKHRRSGHLLGGRYKAKLVEGDEYLLRLTRYVHLNPVKLARLKSATLEEKTKALRAYRWSSYRGYAGMERRAKWVDYGPLGDLVGQGRGGQAGHYRAYVESGLAQDDDELKEALEQSSKAVGGAAFCRWAESLYRELTERQKQPLDVAMRRVETPVTANQVFKVVCAEYAVDQESLTKRRSVSDARVLAMKLMKEEAGLTQRGVAVHLGLLDGSGISRRLSELTVRLEKERRLRKRYERLRKRLVLNH
ncbi:MAG: transposase [Kiritimatiellae bacterium]|nr:transposase [Kiritimatiellia bacterium]